MVKTPEGWEKIKLSSLIDIKHGFAFKGEYISDIDNGKVLLTPGNFLIGGGWKEGKKRYTGEIPSDYILKGGDLVVTMTDLSKDGDTLGYPALIPNDENRIFLHNQRIGYITINNEKIDKMFLYYLMRNREYQKFIVNFASGSTVRHTSPDRIKSYEFFLPTKDEQKIIAKTLSAFDDKIELLRAENQTLEEMGQTLFKEWFISPLAPGRGNGTAKNSSDSKKEKSPLGDLGAELPDGWKVGKLGDIVEFIIDNRGKTPLTSDKGDYPMVEINAIIGDGMIINISDCKKFVGEELYNTWFRKGHPKRGDVLFSTVGSIGEIAFVFDEIFCIAQNIVGLRSKYGKYMYLLLKSIQGNLKALDISSVQPSIKLPHLLDYDIVIPDEIIIKEFETKVSPIFEKINNNGKQINTLISTRDQLLPKLMSGEVRVKF